MNIILIGPVSDNIARAKRVFMMAERLLTSHGHIVVCNPMRNHVAGLTEAQYMAKSLSEICMAKDQFKDDLHASLLPYNWESAGCEVEIMLCKKLEICRSAILWRLDPFELKQLQDEHHRKV